MIGTRVSDRYRIDSELGNGGMGTVYKGFDTILKRDIAIKMMLEPGMEEECRTRIMREAHAIAQLSHPNIITIYDIGEHQKAPYIVMEYIEGENLFQHPPKDPQMIVKVCQQICSALAHAHDHGIIHRDLKPENVILTPDGTAKLMDFGLARPVSSRVTKEGTISGSVFYLAPEQAQKQTIDPRSDLYSLGVMLYELTTGELPFLADDPLSVVSQHIHAPVVPPIAKNGRIPPALETLILDLLKKDPDERPSSARVIIERLSAPDILDLASQSAEKTSALDRIVRGRLVGRKQELQQARRLWMQTMGGHGQLLLISGEAGVGKTRLMQEIVTHAKVSGGDAFIGESQEEGNAPYAVFAQAIRRALRQRQDTELDLPKLVLPELLTIVPELQIRYPDLPPNPTLEPHAEQRRLFECIITFFSTFCKAKPLLLVLEDIHWADSGTLALLEFMARRCHEHPVLLLCTYRDIPLDEESPLQQTLYEFERRKQGTHIKLERLNIHETHDMLANIFTEHITPEFLDGIFSQSEGNPFFIEEICKTLIESGELYFDGDRWHRPTDMADANIPQSIMLAIQSRVSKLNEPTQEILRNAAVIGREFSFGLLQKVSNIAESDLIDCLEAALKSHLVEELKKEDHQKFSFTHALIPTALRESMSGIRQAMIHRKVAATLEEFMPEAYQRLAYHWGESGNQQKRLDYTIKAAVQAKQTYANQDAIRFFSEVLELLPKKDDRYFDLVKTRAELFNFVADRKSQHADIKTMLEISNHIKDHKKQMESLLALAELYLEIDPPAALEPAKKALNISEELKDLSRQAKSTFLIGRYYYLSLDNHQAIYHFEEAIQITRKAGLKHELIEILQALSRSEFNLGMREAARVSAQEAAALSMELNDPRTSAIGMRELAAAHLAARNYEEGLPVIQTALNMSREIGDLGLELDSQHMFAMMLTGMERYDEAIDVYLTMIDTFDLFRFSQILSAINNLEYCYRFLGEYEKLYLLLLQLLEKAHQSSNDLWIVRLTAGYFAEACFRLGKFQEALEKMQDAFPAVIAMGNQFYFVDYLTKMGIFSAFVGNYEAAYKYLDSAQKQSEELPDSYQKANVWSYSALVALLDGKDSVLRTGIQQAQKGITISKQTGFGVFWEFYFVLAGLHLACKDETKALEALKKAFKDFEADFEGILISPELFLSMASQVYRANNQPEKADEFLRKAYQRVMLVAGKIQDEDLRNSYLENVQGNRELLQEAIARGIAPDEPGLQFNSGEAHT